MSIGVDNIYDAVIWVKAFVVIEGEISMTLLEFLLARIAKIVINNWG